MSHATERWRESFPVESALSWLSQSIAPSGLCFFFLPSLPPHSVSKDDPCAREGPLWSPQPKALTAAYLGNAHVHAPTEVHPLWRGACFFFSLGMEPDSSGCAGFSSCGQDRGHQLWSSDNSDCVTGLLHCCYIATKLRHCIYVLCPCLICCF